MMRDAADESQDTRVINGMVIDGLDADAIRRYRNPAVQESSEPDRTIVELPLKKPAAKTGGIAAAHVRISCEPKPFGWKEVEGEGAL